MAQELTRDQAVNAWTQVIGWLFRRSIAVVGITLAGWGCLIVIINAENFLLAGAIYLLVVLTIICVVAVGATLTAAQYRGDLIKWKSLYKPEDRPPWMVGPNKPKPPKPPDPIDTPLEELVERVLIDRLGPEAARLHD